MKILFLIFFVTIFNICSANEIGSETGFEIPRYASLKSNDSNLRVGPSTNYPILIKYIENDFPIQIIEEYQDWRKIIDINNNSGWLHKRLIKGNRSGIIVSLNDKNILVYNTVFGKIIGEVSPGSIVNLKKCKQNWCLIKIGNHKGWINKKNIWGVKKNEVFNVGISQLIIDYYFKSFNYLESLKILKDIKP